jgi:hypothetical protein
MSSGLISALKAGSHYRHQHQIRRDLQPYPLSGHFAADLLKHASTMRIKRRH